MSRGKKRALGIGAPMAVIVVIAAIGIAASRSGPPPQVAATPTTTSTTTTTTVATTTTTEPPTTTTTAPPETVPEPVVVPLPPPNPRGPRFPTTVATAARPGAVGISRGPGQAAYTSIGTPVPHSHQPLNFEVLSDPGNGWLQVRLRTRPNGSTGWIQKTDVGLVKHNWSIDIDLAARWITVYNGAQVFLSAPVVIGTQYTPTPLGDHFITEGVWEANPGGARGVFIFGTSAHSDVLYSFDGGDGQIGIHGTNAPGLRGSAVSNGCIRLSNADITLLANNVPMGTPIHIHNG